MKKRIIIMLIAIFSLLAFSSCETETASHDVRFENSNILRVLDGKIVFADQWTQMIFTEPESDDFYFELHTQHGGFFIGDEPYPEGSPDRYVSDTGIQGVGSVCWTSFYTIDEGDQKIHNVWCGKKTFLEILIRQGRQYGGICRYRN